ncbi:MAG: F0F1 ATP synthase subunit A [Tepidisphaeraceae bacterium]
MISTALGFGLLAAEELPNPLEHVVDYPRATWYFSDVTIMLLLAAVTLLFLIPVAARRIATGKSNTIADYQSHGLLANMVETVCVYLRDELFKPLLKGDADRFAPLLWTFFWFILVCNLFGLVPLRDITGLFMGATYGWDHAHGIGGTATQSIFVTAALALIAFIVINGVAIARDPVGYVHHLTAGAPKALWIIMVPIEIIGTFVKPFALAMRLFANMTGGHIVVAVMMMFVKVLVDKFHGVGYLMSGIPIIAAIGIYFLEVLVAFIQAYVFTFLTALFLGQLIVHEGHHDAHGHEDPLEEPKIGNSTPHGHVAKTVGH